MYYSIIGGAKSRTLSTNNTEKHHIIPQSLGGSNQFDNIVRLTYREHFICHLLLVRMTTGLARQKMAHALGLMRCIKRSSHYTITPKIFDMIKREVSTAIKERCNTPEYKLAVSQRMKQLWLDPIYRARQLEISKDPLINAKKKHVGKDNGMFGKTHSAKVKAKLALHPIINFGNKTYEEIYGVEKAAELKKDRSVKLKDYCALNPSIRKEGNNGNAKSYKFISPDNEKIIVVGRLKKFCLENGLEAGAVINLLKGRRPTYTGWTASYI